MRRVSRRAFALTGGLIIAAVVTHVAPQAAGETGPGWISLFDGKTIGDEWDRVGATNWRVADGAIVADKRTSQSPAHLVTKTKHKDFQVYVEFWASDNANRGIFLRCQDPTRITDRSCYEVNIFDQRKDPTYGTGAIVHFVGFDTIDLKEAQALADEPSSEGSCSLRGPGEGEVPPWLSAGRVSLQRGRCADRLRSRPRRAGSAS